MNADSEVVKYLEMLAGEIGSPLFTNNKIKQFRGRLAVFVLFVMMVESLLCVITHWENLNSRFQATEDSVVLIFAFAVTNELRKSPEYLKVKLSVMAGKTDRFININQLSEIIKIDNYSKMNTLIHDEQIQLRKQIFENQKPIIKWFKIIVIMFAFVNGILPITFTVFNFQTSNEITDDEIFMPFECWVPLTIKDIKLYMIIIIIQMIGLTTFCAGSFCWFTSTVCSLLAVGSEINAFCVSIRKIDLWLNKTNIEIRTSDREDHITCKNEYERKLHIYLINLIQHHQAIIRAVKMLNESLSWSMLMFNQVCCVQFCLSLYGFFEREETSAKVKYLLLLIPVFWCFTLFCSYGQELTNKSETLSVAMSESSWTDKPEWFKKSICFMLLRSQQPLRITPLRLYTLNFHNMMTVLQAAYSYFNLMHSLNRKRDYFYAN